jgi:murein L,D-transpeptidase YcbB/YkuD
VIEKDPGYLEMNNFPNHYNVYLHDTPAQALFNRRQATAANAQ